VGEASAGEIQEYNS